MIERTAAALRRFLDAKTAKRLGIPRVADICDDPEGIGAKHANLSARLANGQTVLIRVMDDHGRRISKKNLRPHAARTKDGIVQQVPVPLKEDFEYLVRRIGACLRMAFMSMARKMFPGHEFGRDRRCDPIISTPRVQHPSLRYCNIGTFS